VRSLHRLGLGHPTPTPRPFDPDLSLVLDGERYGSYESDESSTEFAFDVPAEPADSGYLEWTGSDRSEQWSLPEAVLAELPGAPSFTRHSLSVSGWPTDGVDVTVDVENTSSWPGTYRAVIVPREGTSAHNVTYIDESIPSGTRTEVHAEFGTAESYFRDRDGETTVAFDDEIGQESVTLRKETPTPEE